MVTTQEMLDSANALLTSYALSGGIVRSATPDLQIEKLRPSEIIALHRYATELQQLETYSDDSPINIGVYSSGGGGCSSRNV